MLFSRGGWCDSVRSSSKTLGATTGVAAIALLPLLVPTFAVIRSVDVVVLVVAAWVVLGDDDTRPVAIPIEPVVVATMLAGSVLISVLLQAVLGPEQLVLSDVLAILRVVKFLFILVVITTFVTRERRRAYGHYLLLGTGIAASAGLLLTVLLVAGSDVAHGVAGAYASETHIESAVRKFRVFGTTGNPNSFAPLLIPGAVYAMGLLLTDNRPPMMRRFALFVLPVSVLTILLTQSRTGLVALLVALTTVLSAVAMERKALSTTSLAVSGVGVYVTLLAIAAIVVPRPIGVLLRPWRADALRARFERWRKLMDSVTWNPMQMLFGQGPNNVFLEHRPFVDGELVLVLFRYGLVGLSLFVLLWIVLGAASYGQFRHQGTVIATTGVATAATVAVVALTANVYHNQQLLTHYAVLYGVVYGAVVDERGGSTQAP
jgi:hypothetical protein